MAYRLYKPFSLSLVARTYHRSFAHHCHLSRRLVRSFIFILCRMSRSLHSAPFFAVRKPFWQNLLKRGGNECYTDH